MWPDGWTDVTADGKRSAQFEHTLLVSPPVFSILKSGYFLHNDLPSKTEKGFNDFSGKVT